MPIVIPLCEIELGLDNLGQMPLTPGESIDDRELPDAGAAAQVPQEPDKTGTRRRALGPMVQLWL